MFTWICPQCGREVPPAYTDCPNCAPGQQAGTPAQPVPPQPQPVAPVAPPPPQAAPAPPPPPPPPPPPQAAPVAYPPPVPQHVSTSPLFAPPPQPSYAPQPVPVMQARVGLPTWLMSVIFALAFLGVGACVYWTVRHFQGNGQPPATAASGGAAAPVFENVPAKPAPGAAANPMQKYVEVVGVRLLQNSKKQTEARFLLVNHSSADAGDLSGTVAILGRTQKEGDEPVGRFTFKNVSLGPYESKEVSALVETKLRVYELPDWQMTVTQVQLTAP